MLATHDACLWLDCYAGRSYAGQSLFCLFPLEGRLPTAQFASGGHPARPEGQIEFEGSWNDEPRFC